MWAKIRFVPWIRFVGLDFETVNRWSAMVQHWPSGRPSWAKLAQVVQPPGNHFPSREVGQSGNSFLIIFVGMARNLEAANFEGVSFAILTWGKNCALKNIESQSLHLLVRRFDSTTEVQHSGSPLDRLFTRHIYDFFVLRESENYLPVLWIQPLLWHR